MPALLVAFDKQDVRLGESRWILSGQRRMRFEWLALLAFRRRTGGGDQGWVTAEEVGRLPGWAGRSHHHVITNIGRYLEAFAKQKVEIVEAKLSWAGPYRLALPADEVMFDLLMEEVGRRLGIRDFESEPTRIQMLAFTVRYARAQRLFFRGMLSTAGARTRYEDSAYREMRGLLEDRNYPPRLRLIALLGTTQVLFQLGRFGFAREMLKRYRPLLARSRDNALTARYYLALAWSHQRGASGRASDNATLQALRSAAEQLERTTDREVAGMLAYHRSGFLTKHGRHEEAVAELVRALEAHLVIGNYHNVQADCIDIGSDLHRLGPESYREAHHWIVLGLAICRWMGIGRDNAHGETILGKMYVERKQPQIARFWFARAVRNSEWAGNSVSLADAHMVMAFWHQAFGSIEATAASLKKALRIFRSLQKFDCAQKEAYMARKFPEVWPRVKAASRPGGHRKTSPGVVPKRVVIS